MIRTNVPRNCVVFLLLYKLTFDSHKWPTVSIDEVKGKPCNFEAYLCVMDHCILLLKHLSNHMHFIQNGPNAFYRPTRPIQGNVFL